MPDKRRSKKKVPAKRKRRAKSTRTGQKTRHKPPAKAARVGQLIADQRKKRQKIYERALGAPVQRWSDLGALAIDVCAFSRKIGNQRGFVLVTNGMSDHRIPRPDPDEAYPQTELAWFTREATDEKARFLYEAALRPFTTRASIRFGEFVTIDAAPDPACDFRALVFLKPITQEERLMHTDLALLSGYFEMLVVHLLSPREHARASRSDDGFNDFVDLLDKNKYPVFFDPSRQSYL